MGKAMPDLVLSALIQRCPQWQPMGKGGCGRRNAQGRPKLEAFIRSSRRRFGADQPGGRHG